MGPSFKKDRDAVSKSGTNCRRPVKAPMRRLEVLVFLFKYLPCALWDWVLLAGYPDFHHFLFQNENSSRVGRDGPRLLPHSSLLSSEWHAERNWLLRISRCGHQKLSWTSHKSPLGETGTGQQRQLVAVISQSTHPACINYKCTQPKNQCGGLPMWR